jgi:hypothetical protein
MRVLTLTRAVALAVGAACFGPDEKDGAVRCGPPPDVCPPDFSCLGDGLCWKDRPADARLPACSDGIDNDCDGRTDYPDDPGCSSPDDDDEHGDAVCDDGIDNDGDGKTDYHVRPGCGPGDEKCKSPTDDSER